MKTLLRQFIPAFVVKFHRSVRRKISKFQNKNCSVEDVFTKIYKNNKWGGAKGEFCSGSGSVDQEITEAYISVISEISKRESFGDLSFVDLGCGDFRIGSKLLPLCKHYTGVDIVKPIVTRNQELFGNINTEFLHLDILKDDLPLGDVCFVRQVMQHLSNQQISLLLPKLKQYQWVFVTEHYPTDNDKIIPNKDKVHGGDIRLYDNSGVYLSLPPFSLQQSALKLILEVPGSTVTKGDRGIIRTFIYNPSSA